MRRKRKKVGLETKKSFGRFFPAPPNHCRRRGIYSSGPNRFIINLNQLIQDCSEGKRQAQSELYGLFAPKMFTVCLRYSHNRQEAEETLQEGFIKVFEHLHQFRHAGSFEGWIRKIMVNCALQRFRSKSHLHALVSIDNTAYPEAIAPEDIVSRLGTKELLRMVHELPTAYRLVFNLYVFEGLKHREVAQLLGISEGTSKSNLYDARIILQRAVATAFEAEQKNINCI